MVGLTSRSLRVRGLVEALGVEEAAEPRVFTTGCPVGIAMMP